MYTVHHFTSGSIARTVGCRGLNIQLITNIIDIFTIIYIYMPMYMGFYLWIASMIKWLITRYRPRYYMNRQNNLNESDLCTRLKTVTDQLIPNKTDLFISYFIFLFFSDGEVKIK